MNINQNPVAKALIFGLLVTGGTAVTPTSVQTLGPETPATNGHATKSTYTEVTEKAPSITVNQDHTNQ